MRSSEADRGSVSAEAALVIPALVLFTMALVWALTAASAQIRCVDAARAGARAAARSEPQTAALAVARSAAPRGARITLGRSGELWQVRVRAPMPGPDALALTLEADAAALAEDEVGATGDGGAKDSGGTKREGGTPGVRDSAGKPGDEGGEPDSKANPSEQSARARVRPQRTPWAPEQAGAGPPAVLWARTYSGAGVRR
ncbi:TadE family type IV pilus minor pilin [Streptomyces sp. NBC_01500]|uniref:TadE family type IV pilus minor pilin n=1 Tax=Streptomyces sp. NBC_01500 TaxID=2903886 RepID=UPI002B1CE058|nr:TadE family type IV pilus minor pilin [Streptomyces sp. NBC_01500]